MALTVNQGCCGCTLKTGTIVIGVVTAVGAFSVLLYNIKGFGAIYITRDMAKFVNYTEETRVAYNNLISVLYYLRIISSIIMVLQLILGVMLVFGANSESTRLIRSWVISSIIFLVLLFIVYSLRYTFISKYAGTLPSTAIVPLVIVVIALAWEVYFIIVVSSFHKELMEGQSVSTNL